MKSIIKRILKALHLYLPIVNWHNKNVRRKYHRIKQKPILEFRRRFNPKIFIETGTFHGEMVEAMRNRFKKIYSIELADKLYKQAQEKFSMYQHIKILHGDSANLLPKILDEIHEPALFWLDAHYSGGETAKSREGVETPIESELRVIFDHPIKNHIILIDDVGDFVGKKGYPQVNIIEQLAKMHGYQCEIKYDNFRLWKEPRANQ